MMMTHLIRYFFLTSFLLILTSCHEQKNGLNIAVASNFEKTLKVIVKHFKEKHPESNVNIISGASGVLANQILNNAPFDLFLSADIKKPQFIFNKMPSLTKPVVYAVGQLALWIPNSKERNRCINVLSKVETLVIANPKTAPYGAVSEKILSKHSINIEKTIHAANIAQSFLYTKNKFAEAGFVAYSMLKGNDEGCQQIFQHRELSQSMILLDEKARDIYHFILSEEIQKLIEESGYNTVNL
jgi:molybdate transport system substrate-binding protein